MTRKAGVRAVVVGLAVAVVLALAGVAAAASLTPTLGHPNHRKVHAGRVTLKVYDPAANGLGVHVFAGIGPKKAGLPRETKCQVTKRCSFVEFKPWSGHPGWWIYKAPRFSFHGYWATTPGKLYWQAVHADCSHFTSCTAASPIGSFRVVG
jgi:hypothetical protein